MSSLLRLAHGRHRFSDAICSSVERMGAEVRGAGREGVCRRCVRGGVCVCAGGVCVCGGVQVCVCVGGGEGVCRRCGGVGGAGLCVCVCVGGGGVGGSEGGGEGGGREFRFHNRISVDKYYFKTCCRLLT